MKIIKTEKNRFQVEGHPSITIEKCFTFWDVFVNGSVHQSFGSFNSLYEVTEKLKKYTAEKIIATVDFGDLDS